MGFFKDMKSSYRFLPYPYPLPRPLTATDQLYICVIEKPRLQYLFLSKIEVTNINLKLYLPQSVSIYPVDIIRNITFSVCLYLF